MQKTILKNRNLWHLFCAILQIYPEDCRSYIRTVHAVYCATYRTTCSLFIVQRIWENYAIAADKCIGMGIAFFYFFPSKTQVRLSFITSNICFSLQILIKNGARPNAANKKKRTVAEDLYEILCWTSADIEIVWAISWLSFHLLLTGFAFWFLFLIGPLYYCKQYIIYIYIYRKAIPLMIFNKHLQFCSRSAEAKLFYSLLF